MRLRAGRLPTSEAIQFIIIGAENNTIFGQANYLRRCWNISVRFCTKLKKSVKKQNLYEI